jgi:uncharacterized protein YjbI with pentapeptide repeats
MAGYSFTVRCSVLRRTRSRIAGSLEGADLQGASLNGAQLQGASLEGADLQGASLEEADLRGASLQGANLQGASLNWAQLQGASFHHAQLQGASLQSARLEATDLSGARLWRTIGQTPPSTVATVKMSGDESWKPEWTDKGGSNHVWDNKTYERLRTTVKSLFPPDNRDDALARIMTLDCSSSDLTLASCDLTAPPPREATMWRAALEAAQVDEGAYLTALANTLTDLVCSGDDPTHIVRGAGFRAALTAALPASPNLIDDLTNKDKKTCPVGTALTDADRASLVQLKQAIETGSK